MYFVEKMEESIKKLNVNRGYVKVIRQNLAALKNLEVAVEGWDPILLAITTRKLDAYGARSYQLDRDQDTSPTMAEFLDYLDKRALSLENTDSRVEQPDPTRQSASMNNKNKVALATTTKTPMECIFCAPAA